MPSVPGTVGISGSHDTRDTRKAENLWNRMDGLLLKINKETPVPERPVAWEGRRHVVTDVC